MAVAAADRRHRHLVRHSNTARRLPCGKPGLRRQAGEPNASAQPVPGHKLQRQRYEGLVRPPARSEPEIETIQRLYGRSPL